MAGVETLPPLGPTHRVASPPPRLASPLAGLLPEAQFGWPQLGAAAQKPGEKQQQRGSTEPDPPQQPAAADGRRAASPPPGATPTRLPVHLRHTNSSRMHATVDPESDSAAFIRSLLRRDPADAAGGRGSSGALGATHGAPAESAASWHRAEKVRDLVARKRQIFLAQMSLDIKHSEIAKLEQRAAQREEVLVASEAALEADSQRFEEFLKENDAKLQEAVKRAEAEARARGERAAEAKRLAGGIASLRGETAKIEEQLAECQRFKAFLDSVTPEEWFESVAAQRSAKKAVLNADWEAQCGAIAERKAAAAADKQRAEHGMQWARTQQQFERAERAHREAAAALRDALAQQDPSEPDYAAVDAEDPGMHFRDPAQLLAVFSQLEGSNMFLIQTAQDAEAALEAARASAEAAQAEASVQTSGLAAQVAELEAAVAAARERCERLRAAAAAQEAQGAAGGVLLPAPAWTSVSGGATAAGPPLGSSSQPSDAGSSATSCSGGVSLAALSERLAAAYEAAGFARDASVTPLHMLQKVEARLEELLSAVGPPGSAAAAAAEAVERAREKERRQAARAGKLAMQQAEHEARVARVLARAAAPKFQKSGKPTMTRSVLLKQERRRGGESEEGEAEELAAFLALVDEALVLAQ